MALAVNILLCGRINKETIIKSIILIATIFSTYSTTGIILVLLIVLFAVMMRYKEKLLKTTSRANQKVRAILFILGVIVFIISAYFVYQRMQTNSYSRRIEDYSAGFQSWIEHPIMGNGFQNLEATEKYMISSRLNKGQANSIMKILSQGGIYLISFYLIAIFGVVRYSVKYKNYNILMFTFIMFVLFCLNSFGYSCLVINLIAVGYSFYDRDKENTV